MIDFNIGQLETVWKNGNSEVLKKEGLLMIYSNDQLYFPKTSIHYMLPEFNNEYIDHFIEKGFEFGLIQNRIDEIEDRLQEVLRKSFNEVFNKDLQLFNIQDVEYVINGCGNWLKIAENVGNGIYIEF